MSYSVGQKIHLLSCGLAYLVFYKMPLALKEVYNMDTLRNSMHETKDGALTMTFVEEREHPVYLKKPI